MNVEEALKEAMAAHVAGVRATALTGETVRRRHRSHVTRFRVAGAAALTAVVAAAFPAVAASPVVTALRPDAPPVSAPGGTISVRPAQTGSAAVSCVYRKDTSGMPAKNVGLPPSKPDMKAKTMTLDTNRGQIVIKLATAQAPCTVNSFEFLAKKNYFDNTRCHRLATPEATGLGMLQCGDPLAKGDGKSKKDGAGGPGYLFGDENLNGIPYTRGTVAMAQGGEDADSNGSQFWISFSDENTQLAAQGEPYTPFGVVVKGMDVVDKIAKGGIIPFDGDPLNDVRGEGSNAPKLPVIIKNVTVSP
ncbi:peptidylprolyl isomerase [Sphaerisporangium fuscum]|uniref:peptidylprolyl isomerase n=1 Tax=Sphaerisporangium fuscum TaxID=2835868 RepID=UPI0027E33AE3|nr:peptidylprolyl isomerase [Sphaerisporangium fuscum]